MLTVNNKNEAVSTFINQKCACKGIRKCAICCPDLLNQPDSTEIFPQKSLVYAYCLACNNSSIQLLTPANRQKLESFLKNQNKFECICEHSDIPNEHQMRIEGIFLIREFINEIEETYLVSQIEEKNRWVDSQSGRFKQDFGPKANFNKRKLKLSTFTGLPHYSRSLISRLSHQVPLLADFTCIDLCNLKYDPSRAACIEPHFDDMWLWGDRLVTVNLLSNTYLTLTPGKEIIDTVGQCQILIPMERYSLLVLSSTARYKWMHSIKKEHIAELRWAITLREASDEFKIGELGLKLKNVAKTYTGISIGTIEEFLKDPDPDAPEDIITKSGNFEITNYLKANSRFANILSNLGKSDNSSIEMLEKWSHTVRFKIGENKDILILGVSYFENELVLKELKGNLKGKINTLGHESFVIGNLYVWIEKNNLGKYKQIFTGADSNDYSYLFNIGELIGEWRIYSEKTFGDFDYKETNRPEFAINNVFWIIQDFAAYKNLLQKKLKTLNLELSLKSKFLATVYNIKRIFDEFFNKPDTIAFRQIGYILSDVLPDKFFIDATQSVESNIKLQTCFQNIRISFYLEDLAIFYANYLAHQVQFFDEIDQLCIFIKLSKEHFLNGYETIFKTLGNVEIEFFKFLILIHLQIKIINSFLSEKKNGKLDINDLYQVLYEFDNSI